MAPKYEFRKVETFERKPNVNSKPGELFPTRPEPHPLVRAAFQRGLFGHAAKLETHREVNPNLREHVAPAIPREALMELFARPSPGSIMTRAPGARGRAGEIHYMPDRLAVTRTATLLQRLDEVRMGGGSLRDAVKPRRK